MVAAVTARKRRYDAQNWRVAPHFSSVLVAQTSRLCMSPLCAGDVSAILTDEGSMVEWVKYSAYGVPFGLPAGDTDSDGDWDGDDKGRIGSGAYDVRKDVNLDGVEDSDDVDQGNAVTGGNHALGRGVLSAGGPGGAVGNRRGYAGYEYAPELEGAGAAGRHLYHVRNRVYDADVGRWTRRDPLGYVDGMGLYEYVSTQPVSFADPDGQCSNGCDTSSSVLKRTAPFRAANNNKNAWHRDSINNTNVSWDPDWGLPGERVNCSGWNRANGPPSTWTTPQILPSRYKPVGGIVRGYCGAYKYPGAIPIASRNDCYCWERARIIYYYGREAWVEVALCAAMAISSSSQVYPFATCARQNNAMTHCTYSCCLYASRVLTPSQADDILMAHECCSVQWDDPVGPDDMIRDMKWNLQGMGCAQSNAGCANCCWAKVQQLMPRCTGGGGSY